MKPSVRILAYSGLLCLIQAAQAAPLSTAPPSPSPGRVCVQTAREGANSEIQSVTPITKVFADGLKVISIAILYDHEVQGSSLRPEDFSVQTGAPQRVLRAYTNTEDLPTTRPPAQGRYVLLDLSVDYTLPAPAHRVFDNAPRVPPSGPPHAPTRIQGLVLNPEVITSAGGISWDPGSHPATLLSVKHGGDGVSVSVGQTGTIATTHGGTISPSTRAKDNVYVRNLVVDGFLKAVFDSALYGSIKYNIHFPAAYDVHRHYPLVVFLSDADAPVDYRHAEYLVHGQGGVIWADPAEAAKHPAIVLVPALRRPLVNQDGEEALASSADQRTGDPYRSVLELVSSFAHSIPGVDASRIYLTGQGEGATAALRMLADRPGLFAASLLFAPVLNGSHLQVTQIAALAKQRLWVITAQGDPASYDSMQALMAALMKSGGKLARAQWNGENDAMQTAAEVRRLASASANLRMAIYKAGTLVPPGTPDDARDEHAYTWRLGYANQALRHWIFTQP